MATRSERMRPETNRRAETARMIRVMVIRKCLSEFLCKVSVNFCSNEDSVQAKSAFLSPFLLHIHAFTNVKSCFFAPRRAECSFARWITVVPPPWGRMPCGVPIFLKSSLLIAECAFACQVASWIIFDCGKLQEKRRFDLSVKR